MNTKTKPSDYADTQPCCSIFGKTENEEIAREAVRIMGDTWRRLTVEEFKEKAANGWLRHMPEDRIETTLARVTCEEDAAALSLWWKRIYNEAQQ